MDELIRHYNKFNEDKRLLRRHGQVEFIVSMKYIHKYLDIILNKKNVGLQYKSEEGNVEQSVERLNEQSEERFKESFGKQSKAQFEDKLGGQPGEKLRKNVEIIDIGAGTGRYSAALCDEGYDVTAVEYVPANLSRIKQKDGRIKAYRGDARSLKKFKAGTYDLTICFGPLYHLYTKEDKLKALLEAKRITKPGGFILVGYLLNEYAVLTYGFKEGHLFECLEDGRLDENFRTISKPKDLYEYVRLEDINELNKEAGLERVQIIAPDGPTDFLRREINAMDDAMFQKYIEYQISICERPELLGASSHVVDILKPVEIVGYEVDESGSSPTLDNG